jgi:hypothetical protein
VIIRIIQGEGRSKRQKIRMEINEEFNNVTEQIKINRITAASSIKTYKHYMFIYRSPRSNYKKYYRSSIENTEVLLIFGLNNTEVNKNTFVRNYICVTFI